MYYCKFRLEEIYVCIIANSDLKKVEKTTKPLRHDLNQIPYDYIVEVKKKKFKRLDLRDRATEELWMEVHNIEQKAMIKTITKKKKCKNAKWFSEENLQIAEKRSERKRRKVRKYSSECSFKRQQGEVRKPS